MLDNKLFKRLWQLFCVLLPALFLAALGYAKTGDVAFFEFVARYVSPFVAWPIRFVSNIFPFSLTELAAWLFAIILILVALLLVSRTLVWFGQSLLAIPRIFNNKYIAYWQEKTLFYWRYIGKLVFVALCLCSYVVSTYLLFHGFNYGREPLSQKLWLKTEQVDRNDLEAASRYVVRQLRLITAEPAGTGDMDGMGVKASKNRASATSQTSETSEPSQSSTIIQTSETSQTSASSETSAPSQTSKPSQTSVPRQSSTPTASKLPALPSYDNESYLHPLPSSATFKVPESTQELFNLAVAAYQQTARYYHFLDGQTLCLKPVTMSYYWSFTDTTGMYMPLFLEANVNVSQLPPYLLFTAAHELAHQRFFAREDEANFLAFFTLSQSQNLYANYSAYLNAWNYLVKDLYMVNPRLAMELYAALPARCQRDSQLEHAYWWQFKTPVARESQHINDEFIKANGDIRGIDAYDEVSRLIIAYLKSKGRLKGIKHAWPPEQLQGLD